MSVDYGDVRTGIAVCDKNEILASPVTVLTERDAQALARKIAALAEQYRVERLLVGLPKNMDGTQGARAQASIAFASLLETTTGIPTELRDERLTTVSAHRALTDAGVFGKKRKQTVDAVSAVFILQDYIDARKMQ